MIKSEKIVGPGFYEKVYRCVKTVPYGYVATYGDIACALGSSRVARHVGWALSALQSPEKNTEFNNENIPWHRIVSSTGKLSNRKDNLRANFQKNKLLKEGVVFDDNGKIKFDQHRWHIAML